MKKEGFTLIELLVVIAIIAILMGMLMPALNKAKQLAYQLVCGTNLKGIGASMAVYAASFNDEYPSAGGPGSVWRYGTNVGIIPNWQATQSDTNPASPTPEDVAFGILRNTDFEITKVGEATITSSFFLLLKHGGAQAKQFFCRGDDGIKEFKFSYFPMAWPRDIKAKWDFGGGDLPYEIYPGEFCSYSFHHPYAESETNVETFHIVDFTGAAHPMCADRSPFLDRNALDWPTRPAPDDYHSFNSAAHFGKGQSVLYKDGHAKFESSPCVGVGRDNIYTYGGSIDMGGGTPDGTAPDLYGDVPSGFPVGEKDAYLLSERNYRPP